MYIHVIGVIFQYFEHRFNYKVRLLSTLINIFNALLMMPITLYAPSIVMSHMTQLPVLFCTSLIGSICILYTTFVSLISNSIDIEKFINQYEHFREVLKPSYGQTLCKQH